jgi:hypothetical protein
LWRGGENDVVRIFHFPVFLFLLFTPYSHNPIQYSPEAVFFFNFFCPYHRIRITPCLNHVQVFRTLCNRGVLSPSRMSIDFEDLAFTNVGPVHVFVQTTGRIRMCIYTCKQNSCGLERGSCYWRNHARFRLYWTEQGESISAPNAVGAFSNSNQAKIAT